MAENYRTVKRVVAVLDLLASSSRPLRLTDVATATGTPLSSAHLLLQELVKSGMVQRANHHEYEAGPELLGLSVRVLRKVTLLESARPVMRELVESTEQDVFLAVPCGDSMMYIDRINGPHSLRLEIPMGVPRAVHSTAIGQLFLANIAPELAKRIIESAELAASTPHTITDSARLQRRVAQVRKRGVAVTDQESVDGILAIAGPVRDLGGSMVAALSLSVFRSVGLSKRELLEERVQRACATLSARLAVGRTDR